MPPGRFQGVNGLPPNPYNGIKGLPPKPRRESANKAMEALGGKKLLLAEQVEIEDFHPPTWRSVLNSRTDLGFPDFYPSRPGFGQYEDVLTEENVKNGFQAKIFLAPNAESFSMHGPIHAHLQGGGLDLLNQLGEEIMTKRDENMPSIGERSFRIPPRNTFNDAKRLQLLADIANPDIPLHRLMRNPVPHGFKGVELFDSMFAPATLSGNSLQNRQATAKLSNEPVPVDRAIWFIRVQGAIEIAAHRGRPIAAVSAPSPAAATPSSTNTAAHAPTLQLTSNDWHTQEFTNLFTAWLRIQLGQLILPIPNKAVPVKPALPSVKAPVGVLGDEKARNRWLAKWEYGSELLRGLYERQLVSSRILMSWLTDMMNTANLAQVGFVANILGEYLPDMSRHVSISRHCLRALCDKVQEIRNSPAAETMQKVESLLTLLITSLVISNSEVLLSPTTWRIHSHFLKVTLRLEHPPRPDGGNGERSEPPSNPVIPLGVWQDLERRNQALLFKPSVTQSTSSPRRHQMEEIHKLDSISFDTNMSDLCKSFFDGNSSPTSTNLDLTKVEEKVSILLNWAMGLYQLGIHRPYGIYTLIKMWSEKREKYITKTKGTPIDLFPILYSWLDTSSAAKKPSNVQAIGITYGEFTRQGLFSYGRYLQTLIARGQTARSRLHGPMSHHLPLLKAMPIFVRAKDLLQQRRIALSGDDLEKRQRDGREEDEELQTFMEEITEYIPEIFGHDTYGRSEAIRDVLDHHMPSTDRVTRHIFLQARFWISDGAYPRFQRLNGSEALNASTFVRIMHVYRLCMGYSSLADVSIKAIQRSEDEEILRIVLDTLKRDADVWTAMDRWPMITEALMERHQALELNRRYNPALSALLIHLGEKGRLAKDDLADVKAYVASQERMKAMLSPTQVKSADTFKDLSKAIASRDVTACASLGSDLNKDGRFEEWSSTWWSTVLQALPNPSSTEAIANNLRAPLEHIKQLCEPTGRSIDKAVIEWLEPLSIQARIDVLVKKGQQLSYFLLHLVTQRRLSTRIILDYLCYPIWKQASSHLLPKGRVSGNLLLSIERTIILASQLLLTIPPDRNLPPSTLQESFIAQTSRSEVFDNHNILILVRHLPFIVIFEASKTITQAIRDQCTTLLQGLARIPEFKTAAFRQLEVLKDTFLSSEWGKPGLDPAVEAGMVDTLKAIMSEGSSGAKNTLPALGSGARFSAWRWTRIVLEMRVEFKRLAMRIENNDDPVEARDTLRKLIQSTLDRDASSDDADLLCETFRGIEPIVVEEILAAGLDRLCTLLSQVIGAEDQDSLKKAGDSIDLVLRVLDTGRPNAPIADNAVLSARQRMIELLAVCLQSVERQLGHIDETELLPGVTPPEPGDALRIAIRLVKFTLGLPIVESTSLVAPRPDFGKLAVSFLRVLATPSMTASHDQGLSDLLAYIVDATPPQTRALAYAALLAEASSSTVQAVLNDSPEIVASLPHASPPRRPMTLKGPGMLDDGSDGPSMLLDDRPWELFEQMFPLPKQPPHGQLFLSSKTIRDTASIPTSFFDPHLKRDEIPRDPTAPVSADGEDIDEDTDESWPWLDYASERTLGNGLVGEPISARQASTLLYAADESVVERELAKSSMIDLAASPSASISAVSNATRSRRMSVAAHIAAATKPSAAGSHRDLPISVDEDDSSEEDEDEEDEPQVIEGPAAKRPRTGGKTVVKTTIGGKRPVVGGKAPARKTYGGKNVSGKATAAKTTRKASASKSVRKRSNAD